MVDRRFGPVGRILRASGTSDPATFKAINVALSELNNLGRLELLRAVRDGVLTPLEVYGAFRLGQLDRLPTAEDVKPLAGAVTTWLPTLDVRPGTRKDYRQYFDRLLAGHAAARVADLPRILKTYRDRCQREGTRTTFNHTRAAVQAFFRDVLSPRHPLYGDATAIAKLREDPRKGNPRSVAQIRALAGALGAHGPTLWALCLTGMRRAEYFGGAWDVAGDRVRIHGTKTAGAERFVPLVFPIAAPTVGYWGFNQALRKATGGHVRVHDLRKTAAHWWESASVPRTRRRLYLGHGRRDISDLYEEHDVRAFLQEDAERLRTFVGAAPQLLRAVQ
jgi:integrase